MTDLILTEPERLRGQMDGGEFVDSTLADPLHPVTLFSLSWCAFCRSAKQLLDQLGVEYRVYELDRGTFLEPRLQQQVRSRLQQITRSATLPQLFVGGDQVGGYTDMAAAHRNGSLAALFEKHHIKIART